MQQPNTPKPLKLKYLFIAYFDDGTSYKQTPQDKSKIDPEKRSEFYDVLQEVEKGKKIVKFSLVEQKLLGNVLSVNLLDGTFDLNNVRFLAESDKVPTLPDKFDLIFYRQHTHDAVATYSKIKDDNQDPNKPLYNLTDIKETNHFTEYFIGWKCTIKGKEYQQKIALA